MHSRLDSLPKGTCQDPNQDLFDSIPPKNQLLGCHPRASIGHFPTLQPGTKGAWSRQSLGPCNSSRHIFLTFMIHLEGKCTHLVKEIPCTKGKIPQYPLVFLETYGSFSTVTLMQSWVISLSLKKTNGEKGFYLQYIKLLQITRSHFANGFSWQIWIWIRTFYSSAWHFHKILSKWNASKQSSIYFHLQCGFFMKCKHHIITDPWKNTSSWVLKNL